MNSSANPLGGALPVAFQFKVGLGGSPAGIDSSFQEVTGLEQTMEVEDVREGGENRFVHKLPKGVNHKNLTLKRGIAPMSSPLVIWCKATLESGLAIPVVPSLVTVSLLDESSLPLRVWMIGNAYPVRWEAEGFNSTRNEVALETIELAYQYMYRLL